MGDGVGKMFKLTGLSSLEMVTGMMTASDTKIIMAMPTHKLDLSVFCQQVRSMRSGLAICTSVSMAGSSSGAVLEEFFLRMDLLRRKDLAYPPALFLAVGNRLRERANLLLVT